MGIPYEVIGVLKPRPQEGAENSINRVVYIPFSTMSDFRNTYYIDMIWLDFVGYNYGGVEKSVRNTLAAQHNFRADDKRALFVFSMMEQLSQFRCCTLTRFSSQNQAGTKLCLALRTAAWDTIATILLLGLW